MYLNPKNKWEDNGYSTYKINISAVMNNHIGDRTINIDIVRVLYV